MSLKRFAWLCAMLLVAGQAQAAIVVDLVAHNGFEACWSQAITKATFLQQIRDSLDGQAFCLGEVSGASDGVAYDACNQPSCAGGATGCPVDVHTDAFSGDFGAGSFSATGTADDISVPITYASPIGGGACTITVSNIELTFAAGYYAVPDGNFGSYMAYLSQSNVSVSNEDASVEPSNLVCDTLLLTLESTIIAQAEAMASDAWAPLLADGTERESVCPLTP